MSAMARTITYRFSGKVDAKETSIDHFHYQYHNTVTSRSSGVLRDVQVALLRLQGRRHIPATVTTNVCIKAAYNVIKTTKEGMSNQELLKELWATSWTRPQLQNYLDTVTRLWVITPAESVVESMARVTKEVFGLHRWLKHEAAATELMVRWNGPDATNANDPLDYVQQRHRFNFRRSQLKTSVVVVGIVI